MPDRPSIEFFSDHQPELLSGSYSVTGRQEVNAINAPQEHDVAFPRSFDLSEFKFKVEGPQYFLEENLVHSVYPPSGAKGDFRADLATITLTRSTLPWERKAGPEGDENSWLHLLLLDEAELALVEEHADGSLGDIRERINQSATYNPLPDDTPVSYLSIAPPQRFLIPPSADLPYLSYARISDEDGGEVAVIMANRLPRQGSNSTVYLVSLEHRYKDGNFTPDNSAERIILPYLYKWKFHTNDSANYFIPASSEELTEVQREGLTETLFHDTESFEVALREKNPKMFSEPDNAPNETIIKFKDKFRLNTGSFHGLLLNLSGGVRSFSYPYPDPSLDDKLRAVISIGAIPSLCESWELFGARAWYRGPLQASSQELRAIALLPFHPKKLEAVNAAGPEYPKTPSRSNELVLFDASTSMKDVSYAAAWEIGVLTALNDVTFSIAFYKWKQQNAIALRHESSYLPNASQYVVTDPPKEVIDKFKSWWLLKGVPLLYIVPSLKMLPPESLSHFTIDKNWVNCFISGAFSIGHTAHVHPDILARYETAQYLTGEQTGFILNSRVVSGWPDFEARATTTDSSDPCLLLRRDLLAPNIALFIFEGRISKLTFQLNPGKLHSGFITEGEIFKKGNQQVQFIKADAEATIGAKTVDITALVAGLKPESHAHFAGKMMETAPKITFEITQKPVQN